VVEAGNRPSGRSGKILDRNDNDLQGLFAIRKSAQFRDEEAFDLLFGHGELIHACHSMIITPQVIWGDRDRFTRRNRWKADKSEPLSYALSAKKNRGNCSLIEIFFSGLTNTGVKYIRLG
jgi:hypothetical protein